MLSHAVLIIALASTIHKARAQDDEAIWNSVSSFFVPSAIDFLILRADYSERELNVDSMLYWSSVRSVPSPSGLQQHGCGDSCYCSVQDPVKSVA
jgi:hypothetical protein